MKSILFRIPKELEKDLLVELEWLGEYGQKFVQDLVWEKLNATKSLKDLNAKGETRQMVRLRLFKKKTAAKTKKKEALVRALA